MGGWEGGREGRSGTREGEGVGGRGAREEGGKNEYRGKP